MGFKENSSHGLHKRWVERKLELEVGKVQAKLLSKGIAIPEPKPDDVEASTKLVVAHLPKLHIDMYGRNPNGTHKPSPERLQRGSGAAKASPSVVERLERMMNPGVMGGLPDELAAAYGLPRSPRGEAPDLSPSGAAYGWRRTSGSSAPAAAVAGAAGAGAQPPGSPSHPRGGVQTSLGSPRLASPRSGSPGATGPLGAHGHSYSNPISAAAASAALARHGKLAGPQSGAPSPSGAAGGGGAADFGAEVGTESPGPPSPAPVQLRPDLEGADARIEVAMSEVERVTLPANEMDMRERVIHLARQVNPNFELQPPRNRARLAGGEYGGGRSRRDLSLWRRSSKHLGGGAVSGATSFRDHEGASGAVSSRSHGGAASRREQALPPLGGPASERSKSIGRSRSNGRGGPSAPPSHRSMAGAGGTSGAAGPGGEALPPLSPASASRQAAGQAHTAGDLLPGISSSASLPKLGARSSGGGAAGGESDLLGRNFPEDTANTLIELWEGALEVQAAEAAARAEAEEAELDDPQEEDRGGLEGKADPDGSGPVPEAAGDAGSHAPG